MHRMRCSEGRQGCGSRFSLKRPPSNYLRSARCPQCGSAVVRSVEKARRKEMNQRKARLELCRCGPFPHQIGTHYLCDSYQQQARF